jgi:hypothetical protein
MSDNLRDFLFFGVGVGAIIALVLWLLWVNIRNSESECDCPPTVLVNQDREGFTVKTFHSATCRFFKKGTPYE